MKRCKGAVGGRKFKGKVGGNSHLLGRYEVGGVKLLEYGRSSNGLWEVAHNGGRGVRD